MDGGIDVWMALSSWECGGGCAGIVKEEKKDGKGGTNIGDPIVNVESAHSVFDVHLTAHGVSPRRPFVPS